jgi:hypothetical protein
MAFPSSAAGTGATPPVVGLGKTTDYQLLVPTEAVYQYIVMNQ